MANDKCATSLGQLQQEYAYLYDSNTHAYPVREVQGFNAKAKFNFTLLAQRRQTIMEVNAFSIDQSNNFKYAYDDYSGYLGLAPYSF